MKNFKLFFYCSRVLIGEIFSEQCWGYIVEGFGVISCKNKYTDFDTWPPLGLATKPCL